MNFFEILNEGHEHSGGCGCGCGHDHQAEGEEAGALVTLVDPETNEEFLFEVFDEFDVEDEVYLVLLTAEESLKEGEEPEAVFMRVVSQEDGTEELESLEDEEFEKVRKAYEQILEEAASEMELVEE